MGHVLLTSQTHPSLLEETVAIFLFHPLEEMTNDPYLPLVEMENLFHLLEMVVDPNHLLGMVANLFHPYGKVPTHAHLLDDVDGPVHLLGRVAIPYHLLGKVADLWHL